MTKDQIINEAMALDPKERDEVAETLWQFASAVELGGELSSDQLAEIRRRIASIDSGEAVPIPGEEVMREFRQRFQR